MTHESWAETLRKAYSKITYGGKHLTRWNNLLEDMHQNNPNCMVHWEKGNLVLSETQHPTLTPYQLYTENKLNKYRTKMSPIS